MAYIAALDFEKWENHKAYYTIWVKDCIPEEHYYNCVYYNDRPKNSCGKIPSGNEYTQECYVSGGSIDYGGRTYTAKLWLDRCEEGTYEDSESLFIPTDPDLCEIQCQTSCEIACQGSCEAVCQSYCELNCQTQCELSCQTACQVTSQFCGRDCGRGCGR